MNKSRNVIFDIAKGLCIILVVIGHYNPIDAAVWWRRTNEFIYTFHMPVFLFISGWLFMLTRREESYLTFVGRKVRRLMQPYLIVSVVIITIKLLSSGDDLENPVTPLAYVSMLWKPSAGFFLWFIWTLFTMFLIVPLLKTPRQRLVCALVFLGLHFLNLRLPDLFALHMTARMGVYFMLGIVAYDWRPDLDRIVTDRRSWIFVALMAGLEWLFLARNDAPWSGVLWQTLSVLGIVVVLVVSYWISLLGERRTAWLLTVSGGSYMIYLLHTTFMGPFKALVPRLGLDPANPFQILVCGLLVVLPGILLPLVVDRYLPSLTRRLRASLKGSLSE